jgi:hypothetical protein
MSATEIVKCYGTNYTKSGLNAHYQRDIEPNVKAIQDALARGDDPKDITMVEGICDGKIGKGKKTCRSASYTLHVFLMSKLLSFRRLELVLTIISEIVKFYGSNLTKSGLMNHFNRDLTPNIKLLKQAVATGEDPKDTILIEGVRPGKTGKGWPSSMFLVHITRFPSV